MAGMRAHIIAVAAALVACSTDQFIGGDATTDGSSETGTSLDASAEACDYTGAAMAQFNCFGTNCTNAATSCCVTEAGAECAALCDAPNVQLPCVRADDCDGGVCCIEDIDSVTAGATCPRILAGMSIHSACVPGGTCASMNEAGSFVHGCTKNIDCGDGGGTCQTAVLDVNENLVFGVCR
jgi:hypothetical protein